jgi:ParB family chromosome partitioning protein
VDGEYPVESIRVEHRFRQSVGDCRALAESMARVGLLHPIVITTDNRLVAGARRLEAARLLGWTDIPARMVFLDNPLQAEFDENMQREPFTPEERVAIADALWEREQKASRDRQAELGRSHGDPSGKFPGGSGSTRDRVAAALGVSGRTLEKERAVVHAAQEDPGRFGDLPSLLTTASTDAAYREFRARIQEPAPEPPPTPTPETAALAVHFSSATDEWATPPEVLALVVEALGAIDLDPCADDARSVPAARHFTAAEDGLAQEWRGRVYMNPPYGRAIDAWVAKLLAEVEAGRATQAIALVPARTDTQWFRRFQGYPLAFWRGRLRFGAADAGAPFPSVIIGLNVPFGLFHAVFSDVALLYRPWTGQEVMAHGV